MKDDKTLKLAALAPPQSHAVRRVRPMLSRWHINYSLVAAVAVLWLFFSLTSCSSCAKKHSGRLQLQPQVGQAAAVITSENNPNQKILWRVIDEIRLANGATSESRGAGTTWRKSEAGGWQCIGEITEGKRFIAEIFLFDDFAELLVNIENQSDSGIASPEIPIPSPPELFTAQSGIVLSEASDFFDTSRTRTFIRTASGWRALHADNVAIGTSMSGTFYEPDGVSPIVTHANTWSSASAKITFPTVAIVSSDEDLIVALASRSCANVVSESREPWRQMLTLSDPRQNPMGENYLHMRLYYLEADLDSLWRRLAADFDTTGVAPGVDTGAEKGDN